jgi:signal transduction histidine kinase
MPTTFDAGDLAAVARERDALRRVTRLVAGTAPPEEVFAAVVSEAGQLLDGDFTTLSRCEPDSALTVLASWARPPGGPDEDGYRAHGVRGAVGVPITVEGRLWGVLLIEARDANTLPPDTEERLTGFTELVGLAVTNFRARKKLDSYGEEWAALRRVAQLVAQATPPEEVFASVAEEVGRVLRTDGAILSRYEVDGTQIVLGAWARVGRPAPVGARLDPDAPTVHTLVATTCRPARIDATDGVVRQWGLRSAVGAPIMVEDRLWGVVSVGSAGEDCLPARTEERLDGFCELLAAGIAKAEVQADLVASRARIVAADDNARRRLERNLHDGAQQRLVSLGLQLRAAQAGVPTACAELVAELDSVANGLVGVLEDLREIARGLHPAALTRGGLPRGLQGLVRRSAVPVRLEMSVDGRLSEPIELAAYYVVSEALTNVAKHAEATVIDVRVAADSGTLRVAVQDDGRGGADPSRGSGLIGLTDRVMALGGRCSLRSRLGAGTTLEVTLPLVEC